MRHVSRSTQFGGIDAGGPGRIQSCRTSRVDGPHRAVISTDVDSGRTPCVSPSPGEQSEKLLRRSPTRFTHRVPSRAAWTTAPLPSATITDTGGSRSYTPPEPVAHRLQEGVELILKTKVSDFSLHLQWCDGAWESWEDLQSCEELKAIQEKAQQSLDRAKSFASGGGKGQGKEASK